MRKTLAALVLSASAAAPAAELVERIVARVNDKLITQSEFDQRLVLAARTIRSDDPEQFRQVVLEDMIREKLLEERAQEMAVSATDEEIDVAVARVKAQYNLTTDAEFEAALAQNGMSRDDLRRQMRETITLQKVIGRDVMSGLNTSDDAMRLEYERRKDQLYAVPATATVAEIVLKFPAEDAEARQQAVERMEQARGRIQGGAPMADVAGEVSGATHRQLGSVSRGELVEALDAAIFGNEAEFPPPALLPGEIHVFHVTDRKAAGYRPFAEVKEDLKKRAGDELYEKRFGEYLEKLRRDAFVKIYDPRLVKVEKQAS